MTSLGILCIPLLLVFGSLAHASNRIVGGSLVDIKDHPYQLSFYRNNNQTCGAAIIGKKWAVTAEHCLRTKKPSAYQLGAGSSHHTITRLYNVSRIVVHPNYKLSDIALFEIHGEFAFGDTVQPVKLADHELKGGELVNVTGWGRTSDEGEYSDLLRGVTIPIVKHETCEKIYDRIGAEVTKEMICAGLVGEGGKDACQGDSGGPLVGNGTLYGIVSWGSVCGSDEFPGVYTSVAYVRSWISSVTGI